MLKAIGDRYGPGLPWRRRRILLTVGMAGPVISLLAVLVAVAAYPNFNHATQFLSELGGPSAKLPMLFNWGVMLTGVLSAIGGLGFALAVLALGGSRIAAGLLVISFLAAGVGLVISGIYIWPDPRHLWVNLGLGMIIAPLFMLWGIAKVPGLNGLRWFLVGVCLSTLALALITNHMVIPGTVNPANVGWWERLFAIVLVGWTSVAAFALERRLFDLARRLPEEASARYSGAGR